ncbi:MAG: hypothetical protein L3J32_08515 [Rhizobiaceae bacterium]|nr:hypothetical protein [Rhizobiaceae bacterium]
MKNLLYILGALVLLALFYFSGLISQYNLTHPFWHNNATIYGGLIGAIIAFVLFWVGDRKPAIAGIMMVIIVIVFVIAMAATVYYSNIFINAEDFQPLALRVWNIGSYATISTYVILVAVFLRTFFTARGKTPG